MAKEIDKRVVEMEFNNKDFEKAIDVTLESIDELNKKLDTLNNVNLKGFDDLTKAANGVDFSGIATSIDYIASRFSILGIAAQEVKGVIVNEMMEAAAAMANAFNGVLNTIKEKGNARALNLEQAKFQLSNLGVKWSEVSGSIDEAVNDTRFGMDEAAMAASQLVASGVKLGDEMTRALLGISGVAAMTNSEYSDIAHIFTTIAGTGKVYTQQLNMIAARGLNAAAALAKEMGTTEAGVREILSKKDEFVDFSTFARAMFNEYGEAAKKGNDLFTGALANAKAALGRIGEKFYTPFHEYARQILIEVKPVINTINSALTPLFTNLDKVMKGIRDMTVDFLHKFDQDFTLFGRNINLKKEVSDFANWIGGIFNGIAASFNGGAFSSVGRTVLNIFSNIHGILKAVKDAFVKTFGKASASTFMNLADTIEKFTRSLILTEDQLDKIERSLSGIFALFDMAFKIGGAVFKSIILPILHGFGLVSDDLLNTTAEIGDVLSAINADFHPYEPLNNFVQLIRHKCLPAFEFFKGLIDDISTSFGNLTGIHSFTDLLDKLSGAGIILEPIKWVFMGIAGAISYCFESLAKLKDSMEGFDTFKQYVKALADQSVVLNWIKDTFTKIKETISDIFHGRKTLSEALGLDKLKEKFSWLTDIINKFKEHYKSIWEAYDPNGSEGLPVISALGDSAKKAIKELDFEDIFGMIGAGFWAYFLKKSADFKAKLTEVITPLGEIFQQVSNQMAGKVEESVATKFLKIAAGIAILAASALILSRIDPNKLDQAVETIGVLLVMIGLFVALIGHVFKETKKVEKQADVQDEIDIHEKKGAGIFGKVFDKVTTRFKNLKETITEKINDISEVPGLILALGASIFLIVSAIAKLAKAAGANPETFKQVSDLIVLLVIGIGVITASLLSMISDNNELNDDAIKAMAKLFLMMGIAVRLIINSIAILALFPADKAGMLAGSAMLVLILLAALTLIMYIIVQFARDCKSENLAKNLVAMGAAMLMMAMAIQALTIPIAAIAIVGAFGGQIWQAFGIVALLMGEMALIVSIFAYVFSDMAGAVPAMLAGAAAMLIISMAVTNLLIPIAVICGLAALHADLDAALATIVILSVVMAALVALFGGIGGATGGAGAVGMLAGAASMVLMAVALTALMVPLAAIAALNASGNFEAAFTGLINCLIALGIAAAAATFLAPGLYAIAAAVLAFGACVFLIGTGLYLAAAAVLTFVAALAVLQLIDFEKLGQKIALGGAALIHGFVVALVAGIPDVVAGTMAILAAILQTIVNSTAMIAEAAIKLLTDVIIAIDNHSAELGYHLGSALSHILGYAVGGVLGGFGDLLMSIFGIQDQEFKFSDFIFDSLFGDDDDTKVKDKSKETVNNISTSMSESVDDNKSQFSGIGTNAMEYMASGFTSQGSIDQVSGSLNELMSGSTAQSGNELQNIMSNFSQQGVDGVTTNLNSQNGINIADNFANPLTTQLASYSGKGYDAGNLLGTSIVQGTKDGTAEASPSKEAIKIGKYFNEGLEIGLNDNGSLYRTSQQNANGIVSMFNSIKDAGKEIFSKDSVKSLSETIAKISQSELLNNDLTPTISPVLDLSNINSGLGLLDGMFGTQRSIALAGEAAYMQEANRNMTLSIQNDNSKNLNNGVTSLGTKIDRLGEAIMNRQIVLDSGEVVGGLVNPMDRALGVRAIRAQRGGRR